MQISSVAMAGSAFLFDLKKDENKNNNNKELKMNCYLKESFSLNGNIHQYIQRRILIIQILISTSLTMILQIKDPFFHYAYVKYFFNRFSISRFFLFLQFFLCHLTAVIEVINCKAAKVNFCQPDHNHRAKTYHQNVFAA